MCAAGAADKGLDRRQTDGRTDGWREQATAVAAINLTNPPALVDSLSHQLRPIRSDVVHATDVPDGGAAPVSAAGSAEYHLHSWQLH